MTQNEQNLWIVVYAQLAVEEFRERELFDHSQSPEGHDMYLAVVAGENPASVQQLRDTIDELSAQIMEDSQDVLTEET